jgi:hypothetical protein
LHSFESDLILSVKVASFSRDSCWADKLLHE